jgi:hypothetical protein
MPQYALGGLPQGRAPVHPGRLRGGGCAKAPIPDGYLLEKPHPHRLSARIPCVLARTLLRDVQRMRLGGTAQRRAVAEARRCMSPCSLRIGPSAEGPGGGSIGTTGAPCGARVPICRAFLRSPKPQREVRLFGPPSAERLTEWAFRESTPRSDAPTSVWDHQWEQGMSDQFSSA